ncbi:MAG: metallophosphoesterase family protein [Myxococcota bacterium]
MGGIYRFKKINIGYPIKCGVISDTHSYTLSSTNKALLHEKYLSNNINYLIHLGDITHPSVINDFELMGFKTILIQGNNDGLLRNPHVIELCSGKYRLGLVHGSGGSYDYVKNRCYRLVENFIQAPVDGIMYGHTHVARDEMINNIRYMNPGSLCAPRNDPEGFNQKIPSLATLEINDKGINFRITFINQSLEQSVHSS